MSTDVTGVLIKKRIIIWNKEYSKRLFGNGYYGKPLGISKPKGPHFESPLILDLIEGCYLVEKGRLRVCNVNGRFVSFKKIVSICRKGYNDFDRKYFVFQVLRDKGYIVSSGIKFGCDFAVYEQGPGIDHAPYLVQVFKPTDRMTATGIVLAGRLATTVKKQFILAIPRINEKTITFVGFEWWRA
jgi:tRNA-intron endonuclease